MSDTPHHISSFIRLYTDKANKNNQAFNDMEIKDFFYDYTIKCYFKLNRKKVKESFNKLSDTFLQKKKIRSYQCDKKFKKSVKK